MRNKQIKPGYLSDQSGVTLIEVMVAIVIVLASIMSLLGVQARMMSFSNDAEYRTQATVFASSMIAEIKSQLPDLLSGTYATMQGTLATNYSSGGANFNTWKSRIQATGTGLPEGNITASYTGGIYSITINWRTRATDTAGGTSVQHQYLTDFAF